MIYPKMREQLEIQRVHDLLGSVFGTPGLRDVVIMPGQQRPLLLVLDCLCWVLHHEGAPDSHAGHFSAIIRDLQQDLDKIGMTEDGPPTDEYEVGP